MQRFLHILVLIGVVCGTGDVASTTRQDAAPVTIWSQVYTSAQAERGREIYVSRCAFCHGWDLDGGDNGEPGLRGGYFFARWGNQTLGDLFRKMSTTMPRNEQPLPLPAYADLISLLLQSSRAPAGTSELPFDEAALRKIVITKPQTTK